MMIQRGPKVFAGVISLAAASIASASSVNVQFGDGGTTYSGSAAAPDSNTSWNNLASADQTDSSVTGTGGLTADITVSGNTGGFTSSVLNPSHIDSSVPVGTAGAYDNLTRPQLFVGGGTATITISGLTPGAYFNLYSYEVRGNSNENTKFTITSQLGSPSLTSAPDDNATTG
jgi:hypothetical protein